jgi:chemotaxis-related protein WspD
MTIHREDKASQEPAVQQCWKSIGVMGDATCPKLEEAVHCRNCPVFSEAGQQLFEREPPAEYIEEQTILLSEEADDDDAGSEAMIVFRIGEEWLALDVDAIVEVAQPRTIHRVPHRTDHLLMGIVNIRGELQLCVSLRKLLRIAEDDRTPPTGSEPSLEAGPTTSRLLVCERDGQRWAFAVDEVSGVHRIGIGLLGNVPSTVAKSVKRLANTVFKWKEKSVGRLDTDRLFDSLQGSIG